MSFMENYCQITKKYSKEMPHFAEKKKIIRNKTTG